MALDSLLITFAIGNTILKSPKDKANPSSANKKMIVKKLPPIPKLVKLSAVNFPTNLPNTNFVSRTNIIFTIQVWKGNSYEIQTKSNFLKGSQWYDKTNFTSKSNGAAIFNWYSWTNKTGFIRALEFTNDGGYTKTNLITGKITL